jgi:acyl carrier protein
MQRSDVEEFVSAQLSRADGTRLGPDQPLLELGVLDSLGLMRLVGATEARYGVRIRDEALLPENFSSISAITTLILSQVSPDGVDAHPADQR